MSHFYKKGLIREGHTWPRREENCCNKTEPKITSCQNRGRPQGPHALLPPGRKAGVPLKVTQGNGPPPGTHALGSPAAPCSPGPAQALEAKERNQ